MTINSASYTKTVGFDHRKNYAQYFTPMPIAVFMRNWLQAGILKNTIFDPAFGLGAFFEGLPSGISFSGMDIDRKIIEYFHLHSTSCPDSLTCADYLLSYGKNYENIICNPPYLKFQRFEQKEIVLEKFKEKFGIALSGYTNIASAFLVKSIFELSENGRLAYIMPSEFLNASYGKEIKKLFLERRHLCHIVKIECEQSAFPEATTSLCILLYDSSRKQEQIHFHSISNLDELNHILQQDNHYAIAYDKLLPEEKWEKFFSKDSTYSPFAKEALVPLSTYGHFSRGIATGANSFFVLRKSQIQALRLLQSDYIPCITKSLQIEKPIFVSKDFSVLSDRDASVYLFHAGPHPSAQAMDYIHFGESQGYNQGYITKNRKPWYKMERRLPAPILLNVFSRNGYKVIRNKTEIQTLTNFHCFYPNLLGSSRIDALFLYLLSSIGHKILSLSMRKYGNQLNKFEPNDLNEALVPSEDFLDNIPSPQVKHFMEELSHGKDVTEQIDILFSPLILSATSA